MLNRKFVVSLVLLFFGFSASAQTLQSEFARFNPLSYNTVEINQAWQKIAQSKRLVLPITVAVIDSGVNILHPLLLQQASFNQGEIPNNNFDDDHNGIKDDILGYDYVNKRTFMIDDNGHGTHVSGIIAALNPQARILAIKVLDQEGNGQLDDIQAAIRYAVKRGARVINLSLGAMDIFETNREAYEESVNYARSQGILIVTAAGNKSNNNDLVAFYPSNVWQDNLMSVCAVNSLLGLADFSNYGQTRVHLCAPGTNIYSLNQNQVGQYWKMSQGTSQAAPFVSAAASILFGIKPSLQPYQVRNMIMSGSNRYQHLKKTSQTGGILSFKGAVEQLLQSL